MEHRSGKSREQVSFCFLEDMVDLESPARQIDRFVDNRTNGDGQTGTGVASGYVVGVTEIFNQAEEHGIDNINIGTIAAKTFNASVGTGLDGIMLATGGGLAGAMIKFSLSTLKIGASGFSTFLERGFERDSDEELIRKTKSAMRIEGASAVGNSVVSKLFAQTYITRFADYRVCDTAPTQRFEE